MELQALAVKSARKTRRGARRATALFNLLGRAGLRGKSVKIVSGASTYALGVQQALRGLGAKAVDSGPMNTMLCTKDILAGLSPGRGRKFLLGWSKLGFRDLIVFVDNSHGPTHWTPRDVADVLEPEGYTVARVCRCGTKSEQVMLLRRNGAPRPSGTPSPSSRL